MGKAVRLRRHPRRGIKILESDQSLFKNPWHQSLQRTCHGIRMGKRKKGYETEGQEEFVAWTKEAPELSNPALLAQCQKKKNPCMEQALLWSIHVNLAVKEPGMEQGAFYGVREALEK